MDKDNLPQLTPDGNYISGVPARIVTNPEIEPDWTAECEVCGSTPIVPMTGMCGPCTFGESDTAGGNW